MKLVLQRVREASVAVEGEMIAKIGRGLLVLFGAEKGDAMKDCDHFAEKTAHLRVFPDAAGKMNLSLKDIEGEVLVVSQFTLAGDCTKGRRPAGCGNAVPALRRSAAGNGAERGDGQIPRRHAGFPDQRRPGDVRVVIRTQDKNMLC